MSDAVMDAAGLDTELWFNGEGKLLSQDEVFGYDSNRIRQVLNAAGIDPHMLNAMDRARILTALMNDNVVFEEGGVIGALRGGSAGIADALTLTAEEATALNSTRGNLVAAIYWNGKKLENGESIEGELAAFRKATPDKSMVNIAFGMARDVPNFDEFRLGSLVSGIGALSMSAANSIEVAETPEVPGFEKQQQDFPLPSFSKKKP